MKKRPNPARSTWKLIDHGFYKISGGLAKELAAAVGNGRLPRHGYEKLVKAPPGFPEANPQGLAWLSRTREPWTGRQVWALHRAAESAGIRLNNGLKGSARANPATGDFSAPLGRAYTPRPYVDTAGNVWTDGFLNSRTTCPTANGRDLAEWDRRKRDLKRRGNPAGRRTNPSEQFRPKMPRIRVEATEGVAGPGSGWKNEGRAYVEYAPVFEPDITASGNLSFAVWQVWKDEPREAHEAAKAKAIANARTVLQKFCGPETQVTNPIRRGRRGNPAGGAWTPNEQRLARLMRDYGYEVTQNHRGTITMRTLGSRYQSGREVGLFASIQRAADFLIPIVREDSFREEVMRGKYIARHDRRHSNPAGFTPKIYGHGDEFGPRPVTLFHTIKFAGIPFSNHESDLYIPDTPEVRAILARFPTEKKNSRPFTNQAPPHKGERWLDVPFAFLPFWEKRQNPMQARRLPSGRTRVRSKGGRVTALATTAARASRQMHLLRGVHHGWKPRPGVPALDVRKKIANLGRETMAFRKGGRWSVILGSVAAGKFQVLSRPLTETGLRQWSQKHGLKLKAL